MPQPEIAVVEHLDGEVDALGAEIEDQGVALEVVLVVGVEFDAWLTPVDFFGNDAAAGEDVGDLLNGDVEGKVDYVDCGVFALAGFSAGLSFLGCVGSTASFLSNRVSECVRLRKTRCERQEE